MFIALEIFETALNKYAIKYDTIPYQTPIIAHKSK